MYGILNRETPILLPLNLCWRFVIVTLLAAVLHAAAWAGNPGDLDGSFQVPYPADRGLVRPDGSCVVAGAGTVTVLNHDGSVRHGPFRVVDLDTPFTSEMALLQDGSVIGGFTESLAPAAESHTIVFRIKPSGDLSTVPVEQDANNVSIGYFADLGGDRLAVAGTFPAWAEAPNSGSVLGILSPERTFEANTTHECWGGGWVRAGAVKGLLAAGEGRYLACGYFTHVDTQPFHGIVRLLPNGEIDGAFHPELGINSAVWEAAVLPDGKILVGGWLALPHLGSVAVARLMPDGTLDRTFNPPTGTPLDNSTVLVRSLSVDPAQRIVMFGVFQSLNGVPRPGLARLHPDGTLDASFQPKPPLPSRGFPDYPEFRVDFLGDVYGFGSPLGEGPFAGLQAVRLAGGAGEEAPSVPVNTVRNTLAPGSSVTLTAPVVGNPLPRIQWLKNGQILPGATNSTYRLHSVGFEDVGAYRVLASNALGRVERQVATVSTVDNPVPLAGGLDFGFKGTTNNSTVEAMAPLPGGATLVAFSQKIGIAQRDTVGEIAHGIRRLLADGSVDPGFWTHLTVKDEVTSLTCFLSVLPDGRILIGGNFETVNGVPRRSLARLLRDGSLDQTFDALEGAGGEVSSVVSVPDLGIVVGGQFSRFQNQVTGPLVLLQDEGRLVPGWPSATFSAREGILRVWELAGGDVGVWTTGPQDGLGEGARWSRVSKAGDKIQVVLSIPQDSTLQGVELTQNGRIVFATSGRTNQPHTVVSSIPWGADSVLPPGPSAIVQGRVDALAVDRSHGVVLAGLGSLSWPGEPSGLVIRLDSEHQPDRSFTLAQSIGALASAGSPMLALPSGRVLLPTAQGIRAFYSESEVSTAPRLLGPLGDQDYEVPSPGISDGGSVTFCAPLRGQGLTYSWLFAGEPLPGENRSTLVLTNLQPARLGPYSLIASNSFGSITSSVARLNPVPRAVQIPSIVTPRFQEQWTSLSVPIRPSGSWPLRAQWFRDGHLLQGQNSTTLLLPVLSPNDQGVYQLAVSNSTGTQWGNLFRVGLQHSPISIAEAVDTPGVAWSGSPVWATENEDTSDGVDAAYAPASDSAANAICQLRLTGPGTLSFFWRIDRRSSGLFYDLLFDGKKPTPVAGQDKLVPPGFDWDLQQIRLPKGAHAVSWRFTWANLASGSAAYLDQVQFVPDAPQLPEIVVQPTGVTVREGGSIQLGVGASGFLPMSYRWRKDGQNIPGATGPILELRSVTLEQAGSYDVVVSNGNGEVLSLAARASVLPAIEATRLSPPSMDASGAVSLLLPADAATALELQRSENLTDWFSLPSWFLSASDGNVRLIDPEAGDAAQRYYRMVPTR